jgi:predicted DNA-binding protein
MSNELSETFAFRLSRRDAELLRKISEAKGIDASDFVREAVRRRFAELAFLSQEEKKALGLAV